MSERSEQRRKDLRAKLIDALTEAARGGPHSLLSVDEVVALGVPRRFAKGLSQASRRIVTEAEAVELADDAASTVAASLEADDALGHDPRALAERIGRR